MANQDVATQTDPDANVTDDREMVYDFVNLKGQASLKKESLINNNDAYFKRLWGIPNPEQQLFFFPEGKTLADH